MAHKRAVIAAYITGMVGALFVFMLSMPALRIVGVAMVIGSSLTMALLRKRPTS